MSSLTPEQHVVQHFTHNHPLTKVDGYGEFTCGGCKTYGFGKTYRCAWCDYNLHDQCATCPATLLSFMHPQHKLRLVFRGPEHTHQNNRRMCDICDESVEGLYYHCEPCSFDVHPLCTKLPQHVRHVPHPDHLLELNYWGASNTCMVCNNAIRSWRYKCGPCGLDVHMECVDSPESSEENQWHNGSKPHSHPSQYNNQEHTNQGPVQGSGRRVGRRMFRILKAVTIGVVCNIIAAPISEDLSGSF